MMKRPIMREVLLVLALLGAVAVCMGAKVWRFDKVQITSGTSTANGIAFGSDVTVYRDAASRIANSAGMYIYGDTILGNASTDTVTVTGRLVLRTLASDPLDGTPGNRPAGTVGEVAYYSGAVYVCTNASTPTWVKVGPAS